jgi:hypothetical protein
MDYVLKIIPTRDKKLSKPVINNSKEEVFSIVGKITNSKNRKVIPNADVS